MLGRGELRCIGATTIAEYRKCAHMISQGWEVQAVLHTRHGQLYSTSNGMRLAIFISSMAHLQQSGCHSCCALWPVTDTKSLTRWAADCRYIEKDKALERRFQQVLVEPPSVDETVSILRGLRERCACVSEGTCNHAWRLGSTADPTLWLGDGTSPKSSTNHASDLVLSIFPQASGIIRTSQHVPRSVWRRSQRTAHGRPIASLHGSCHIPSA